MHIHFIGAYFNGDLLTDVHNSEIFHFSHFIDMSFFSRHERFTMHVLQNLIGLELLQASSKLFSVDMILLLVM